MIITHITTSGPSQLSIEARHPNYLVFMYSPQPVVLTCTNGTSDGLKVMVKVTHMDTGASHTETREFYNDRAFFDFSRAMQLLAPDADTLLGRIDYTLGECLSEYFELSITYTDTDGEEYQILLREDVIGMYGALDQGETYGGGAQRRLWLNFPQTFNVWRNTSGERGFIVDGQLINPDVADNGPCHECDFIGALYDTGNEDVLSSLIPGRAVDIMRTMRKAITEGGEEFSATYAHIILVPDDSRPEDGTYLRWLNRRGEVSYWLFKRSQMRTTTSASETFARYNEQDPSTLVVGSYLNPQKANYKEARELVLGAVGLSADEFEDLLSLATSPLVEMLMPNAPLDEYGRVDLVDCAWMRVNVAPGSYTRDNQRNTPNLQDLEFVIELPERNTIKL